MVCDHYTHWRADGDSAVGSNTVPGNHSRCLLAAHRTDAPAQGGHANQPLSNAQKQAPGEQHQEAQRWHIDRQGRGEGQHAADGNTQQPIDDGLLGALAVGHPPGEGPTEQGGQVL
ncbi:hypothetical protein D3C72_1407330 [compost metagenome]